MRHGMIRYGRKRRAAVSGFTLLEALVATALMGVILTALASITSQWLPNWNRGIARAQRSELVSIVLNRLVADFGASEFIPPNRDTKASNIRWDRIFCHARTIGSRAQYPSRSRNRAHCRDSMTKTEMFWSDQQSHLHHSCRTQCPSDNLISPIRLFFSARLTGFHSPMRGVTEFGRTPGRMPANCRRPFA